MSQEKSRCSDPLCVRCARAGTVLQKARQRFATQDQAKFANIAIALSRDCEWPTIFELGGLSTIFDQDHLLSENLALLEKFPEILMEAESLIENHREFWSVTQVETGFWTSFPIMKQGNVVSDTAKFCPKTMVILESLPRLMKGCVFGNAFLSLVEPGTEIETHTGPTDLRVRIHLGTFSCVRCLCRVPRN